MQPPKLAKRLLLWFLRSELAEEVQGDLEEKFREDLKSNSKIKAQLSYWYQVFHYVRPFAIRKSKGLLMSHSLFQNYVKVGVRNIIKHKTFSFINIFGLAVAMAVCMLLILMLADQHRYDQFHTNKDRIYRILSSTAEGRQPYATSPFPLAKSLKETYPIVEETTHLTPGIGGDVVYQQKLTEMRGYFAEPSFFSVFSFQLAKGDPRTALSAPNSVVLSAEVAYELFNDENPIGKVVEFYDRGLPFPQEHDDNGSTPVSWGSFTVTGVIDDSKYKSHLKFDALVSATSLPLLYANNFVPDRRNDWEYYFRSYTYVLLQPDRSEEELTAALGDLVHHTYKDIHSDVTKGFQLTPQQLTEVQLGLKGNDTNNRFPIEGYYFLGFLAIVIMVSASLNYTNLSIARALTRAREIGVRKVTGAHKGSIAIQFMCESVVVALLSMLLATGLLMLIRPAFKNLWVNQFLEFELPQSPGVYFQFVLFALVIGVIAGLYPAVHLANYQPVKVLKGLTPAGPGKLGLRKVLSVSQFILSLVFVVTSILIFRQLNHFMHFDYGFDYSKIVNVQLQGAPYQQVANVFAQVPGVETVAGTDIIPATGTNNGVPLKKQGTTDETENASIILADENFTKTLGISLVAGQPLPADSRSLVLVNETAVRKLGYDNPAQIIGQIVEPTTNEKPMRVVGVVKDFQYLLLVNGREIGPLVIKNQPKDFQYVTVKVGGTPMQTIKDLEQKWKEIDPIHPFKYRFYEDQLAATHQGVLDLVMVLGFIAFLAIVIASLGLLGMTTYSIERKTKEVGIRKVLGASTSNIALLLSREFVIILILAVALGAPLSLFVNNLWLLKLATRVDFGWGTVLMGTSLLLLIGLSIIVSQTLRLSNTNPVQSLKSE
jgi:putative ABC transport system permease protein